MIINLSKQLDNEGAFRQMIEILSTTNKTFHSLRPREKDLLSQLYYYNWLYKDLPDDDRDSIVFSANTKSKICSRMGISMDNLYNISLQLRSKKLIGDNVFIKKPIMLDNITFQIIENE